MSFSVTLLSLFHTGCITFLFVAGERDEVPPKATLSRPRRTCTIRVQGGSRAGCLSGFHWLQLACLGSSGWLGRCPCSFVTFDPSTAASLASTRETPPHSLQRFSDSLLQYRMIRIPYVCCDYFLLLDKCAGSKSLANVPHRLFGLGGTPFVPVPGLLHATTLTPVRHGTALRYHLDGRPHIHCFLYTERHLDIDSRGDSKALLNTY